MNDGTGKPTLLTACLEVALSMEAMPIADDPV